MTVKVTLEEIYSKQKLLTVNPYNIYQKVILEYS